MLHKKLEMLENVRNLGTEMNSIKLCHSWNINTAL